MSAEVQAERLPAGVPTMRAIVQYEYGEAADVLRLAEIERPEPGPGEVQVRVVAAGIDRGALHIMKGLPYPVRLAGFGVRAPKTPVRGREFAGRVEALGAGVTGFRVGEEVFGVCEGGFAEYACARADKIAPKPRALSYEQAAATPISSLTALQALRECGHACPGQQVLVIGASGGVGTFAVQLAKAFGATVTGVCSTGKVAMVAAIGADEVIDYTTTDITAAGQRYDVVLDIGGHRSLRSLRRLLTPTGTLVIVGSEPGGRLLGGTDRQLRAMLLSPFISQTLTSFVASEAASGLAFLTDLFESGQVTPVVDSTVPLNRTVAALQRVDEGRASGKVVVDLRLSHS
ncbi:NAD(P)-dependent alcohol dehydrogenase [Pseudonocardia sp. TRM90224]|uniref:NAD(P)-dependent alcohol dehydrogenase n=1 Tax=Pseudonocardia sp. TRM90224 TaxID=2812678 RepID=UPI001E442A34|nr:NAD(P)-dependent alcohol dehydrogenase [Pseudonocardia sp. TRM90224]